METFSLWKPIEITDSWINADISILTDIAPSWRRRRIQLEANPKIYTDFFDKLKREHALETGVVEQLYDVERGVTETLIREGFTKSYLSHGDTNISKDNLMNYLNDHLEAMDWVFDMIKNRRPFSTSFIKQLHQLVTQNREYAEGRDHLGRKSKLKLLKGDYKKQDNNPVRADGVMVLYCPPEQVSSEMDKLIAIYEEQEKINEHPLIIAAWFHHAFTTIHPFQDGNGRIARLLSSFILIKYHLFPFTVLRAESKVKYLNALEKADTGQPQDLITYFAEAQSRYIQKALNLKLISSDSLEEVQKMFAAKVNKHKQQERQHQNMLLKARNDVYRYCKEVLGELNTKLKTTLDDDISTAIFDYPDDLYEKWEREQRNQIGGREQLDEEMARLEQSDPLYLTRIKKHQLDTYKNWYSKANENSFNTLVNTFSQKHSYFFNNQLPKAWLVLEIVLDKDKVYRLIIVMHHYGRSDSTFALAAFLHSKINDNQTNLLDSAFNKPHILSLSETLEASKKKNMRNYLEQRLTLALSEILNDMPEQ